MTANLPPWPEPAPTTAGVRLRPFAVADVPAVRELSTDPYIPTIGSLSAKASETEALEWIERQWTRHPEGTGYSFAVADIEADRMLGSIGLWCRALETGRATVGYSVIPSARRRGVARDALIAVTRFAWTIPQVHRIEAYIEEWNVGSIGAAAAAGYRWEGLLRSHQEIGGIRRDMLLYAIVRGDESPGR